MEDTILDLPESEAAWLRVEGKVQRLNSGEHLAWAGHHCDKFWFILQGRVRVYLSSSTGRHVILYRVKPGDCCILSFSALVQATPCLGTATTEAPCQIIWVPARALLSRLHHSNFWQKFLIKNYSSRFSTILNTLSEICFERLDGRLATLLLRLHASGENFSQGQMAEELGTAREVVCRQLRQFKERGWIVEEQGRVSVTDPKLMTTALRKSSTLPLKTAHGRASVKKHLPGDLAR